MMNGTATVILHLNQQERVSSKSQMLIMVKRIKNMASICWLHGIFQKTLQGPGVVVHAFNPSTQEAEAGGFLSSRPPWSTK
jgi:hypothetical protein